MVQLKILSGKHAGNTWVSRRFPVRIGRSTKSDLQADDPGVWDQHARIDLVHREGFVLTAGEGALITVNGEPTLRAVLHNGDSIELGSLKTRFWLGEIRQSGLRLREWLTWTGIAAISRGQIALIYCLLR